MNVKSSFLDLYLISLGLLNFCHIKSTEIGNFDFKRENLSNSSRISGQSYAYFRAHGFRVDLNYNYFKEDGVDNTNRPTLTTARCLSGEINENKNFIKDKGVQLVGENIPHRLNARIAFPVFENLRNVVLGQIEAYNPLRSLKKITFCPSGTYRYFYNDLHIGVGMHILFCPMTPEVSNFDNYLKRDWYKLNYLNYLGFHFEGSYQSYVNLKGFLRFPFIGINTLLNTDEKSSNKETHCSIAQAAPVFKISALFGIVSLLNEINFNFFPINFLNPSFIMGFKLLFLPGRAGVFDKVSNSEIGSALFGVKKGFIFNPTHLLNLELIFDSSNYIESPNKEKENVFIKKLWDKIIGGSFCFGVTIKFRSDISTNDQLSLAFKHYGLYKNLGKRLDTCDYLDVYFHYDQIQEWVEKEGKLAEWELGDSDVKGIINKITTSQQNIDTNTDNN